MHWAHYEESWGNTGFSLALHQMANKLKEENTDGKRRFSVHDIDRYPEDVQERNVIQFLGKTPNYPYDPRHPIHEAEWAYANNEDSARHTHFLLMLAQENFSQDAILKEEQLHGNIHYAYCLTFYLIKPSEMNEDLKALNRELWSEFVTSSLKGENE
jgi:hypothetical protein